MVNGSEAGVDASASETSVEAGSAPFAVWGAGSTRLTEQVSYLGVAADAGCREATGTRTVDVSSRMFTSIACVSGTLQRRERMLSEDELRQFTEAASMLRARREVPCSGFDGQLVMYTIVGGENSGNYQGGFASCSLGRTGEVMENAQALSTLLGRL